MKIRSNLLKTTSIAALALFVSSPAFAQTTVSNDQTLPAGPYTGIVVNNGSTVTGTNIDSSTTGASAPAVDVAAASSATFTDSNFTTTGDANAYGVLAEGGSSVTLTGGSVTTQSTLGQNSLEGAPRGYALHALGTGSSITATGTTILTNGQRSYGAHALDGGAITLSDVSITTNGALGYGIYASGANSVINATNLNITTNGFTGDAVWAYNGGHVVIDGGNFTVNGSENPNEPHETADGMLALGGGYQGTGIAGVIDANNVTIVTHGDNSAGVLAGGDVGDDQTYGTINLTNSSVTTLGNNSNAAYVLYGSTLTVANSTLNSVSTGVFVEGAGSNATLTDTDVTTTGNDNAYGVSATQGATVAITGGSVTTASTQGQNTLDEVAPRGYALYADGAGSSITANGTTILTNGQRSYGAYALDGGTIGLTDTTITTNGALGYGVYASGTGSSITATNLNVTTNGFTGDAVWAYNGGHVTINGGNLTVNGSENPNEPHETADGMLALGGGFQGTGTAGVIDATGVTINTFGDNGDGILAGGDVGDQQTYGTINLTDSTVTTHGANTFAAAMLYGSTLNITNSTLEATNGVGISIVDSGNLTLTGSTVIAGQQSIKSDLEKAGSVQTINVNAGSVLTANNGTLLLVTRTGEGADGQITFNLNAGSTSSGDITDNDAKANGGFTDVFVSSQATYSGIVSGVRNFTTDTGGHVNFEGRAQINGNLDGNNTQFTFSDQGGTITNDVTLANGSTTTGGSIATPIFVGGNVDVDAASVLGGNWNIAGNVVNLGTTNPGNSIGLITVGGNYTFGPASTYAVELNAAGQSDLLQVGGTATLGGAVVITPLGGVALNQPYTIVSAGAVANQFDSVAFASNFPFLAATLGYTPTTAFVEIVRSNVSFASLGTTPNQVGVGAALDSLGLNGALVQALALGTAANAIAAFDPLSGEAYASLKTGLFEDSRHVRDAVTSRLADAPQQGGLSLWGNAYGSWGGNSARAGLAKLDRMTKGAFLGLDTSLGNVARIGILGGYSHSDYDVDGRASSANVENYQAGVYAGTRLGGFSLGAGASYTWHRISMDRSVAFTGFDDRLSSRYNANTAQVFGDIGYAFPLGGGEIGPFASAAYVRVHTDAVNERGGAAALTIADQDDDVTFSTVGLRAKVGPAPGANGLSAHAMVGWRHAFNDHLPTIQAGFASGGDGFITQGLPLSKETGVADLGVDLTMGSAVSVGVGYIGQIGGGSSDNGVKARVRISF